MRKNLSFISLISNTAEAFTSSGGIHSKVIASFPNYSKGIVERWTLFSNGKMSAWKKCFIGKLWWDNLNSKEWEILYRCPLLLKDLSIYLGLKAKVLGISHNVVRQRLEILSKLGYLKFPTREYYISSISQMQSFLLKEWSPLTKSPKYSGYTKHYKDKGSLREENELYSSIFDEDNDVKDDFLLHFLLIGEFPSEYFSLKMDKKSPK